MAIQLSEKWNARLSALALIGIAPFCAIFVNAGLEAHAPPPVIVTAAMGSIWGLFLAGIVTWNYQSLTRSTRVLLYSCILGGLYESTASILLRIWLNSYHGHGPAELSAKLHIAIGFVDGAGRLLSIITLVLVTLLVHVTILRRPVLQNGPK